MSANTITPYEYTVWGRGASYGLLITMSGICEASCSDTDSMLIDHSRLLCKQYSRTTNFTYDDASATEPISTLRARLFIYATHAKINIASLPLSTNLVPPFITPFHLVLFHSCLRVRLSFCIAFSHSSILTITNEL